MMEHREDAFDDYREPGRPRLILPAMLWLVVFIGAIAAVLLAGCASSTAFTGTCAMQPIGVTDSGIAVVRMHCEAA